MPSRDIYNMPKVLREELLMPPIKPVLFADLDDSLFSSARKQMDPVCDDDIAAFATNGKHSYMNSEQAAFFAFVLQTMTVVPVTARSRAALGRVRLPFSTWKIASNGGVLLNNNDDPNSEWADHVGSIACQSRDGLEQLFEFVKNSASADKLNYWFVKEADIPIYFCVKAKEDERHLDDVWDGLFAIARSSFEGHRNRNNISFTPYGISKKAAVSYLVDQLDPDLKNRLSFGLGDSLTDVPFMRLSPYSIVPSDSQIFKTMEAERGF